MHKIDDDVGLLRRDQIVSGDGLVNGRGRGVTGQAPASLHSVAYANDRGGSFAPASHRRISLATWSVAMLGGALGWTVLIHLV